MNQSLVSKKSEEFPLEVEQVRFGYAGITGIAQKQVPMQFKYCEVRPFRLRAIPLIFAKVALTGESNDGHGCFLGITLYVDLAAHDLKRRSGLPCTYLLPRRSVGWWVDGVSMSDFFGSVVCQSAVGWKGRGGGRGLASGGRGRRSPHEAEVGRRTMF